MSRHTRYNASEKGRARDARFALTEKAKARKQRYEAKHPERRKKRLFIGSRYVGHAETLERAAVINDHIKERLSAFKGQSSGAQAEGAAESAVPSEAEL